MANARQAPAQEKLDLFSELEETLKPMRSRVASNEPPPPKWNDRGSFVFDFRMTFFASVTPNLRTALEAIGEVTSLQSEAGQPPLWSASILALPGPIDESSHYLTVDAHPMKDNQSVHWHIARRQVPDANPPLHYREQSEKAGGFPGVLEKLATVLPHEEIEVDATFIFFFSTKRWRTSIAGKNLIKARLASLSDGNHKLVPEAVIWRVEPPSGPVFRLTQSGRGSATMWTMTVFSRPKITISSNDLLEAVEQVTWNGLEPLLEKAAP